LGYALLEGELAIVDGNGGVVNVGGELKDWSTLLVRVVEAASFQFAGGTSFQVGDRITGASSNAAATVIKKIQTVGGQDVILLNNVTGTFNASENVYSTNQGSISGTYRVRDNYIWLMVGNTDAHGTMDATAQNGTRGANQRALSADMTLIHWPVNSIANWNSGEDYFRLLSWSGNLKTSGSGSDSTMLVMGTGKEAGAILRTSLYTTGTYTSDAFPYEMGLHSIGDAAQNTYFDDLAIGFPVQQTTTGTFIPPIQQ